MGLCFRIHLVGSKASSLYSAGCYCCLRCSCYSVFNEGLHWLLTWLVVHGFDGFHPNNFPNLFDFDFHCFRTDFIHLLPFPFISSGHPRSHHLAFSMVCFESPLGCELGSWGISFSRRSSCGVKKHFVAAFARNCSDWFAKFLKLNLEFENLQRSINSNSLSSGFLWLVNPCLCYCRCCLSQHYYS